MIRNALSKTYKYSHGFLCLRILFLISHHWFVFWDNPHVINGSILLGLFSVFFQKQPEEDETRTNKWTREPLWQFHHMRYILWGLMILGTLNPVIAINSAKLYTAKQLHTASWGLISNQGNNYTGSTCENKMSEDLFLAHILQVVFCTLHTFWKDDTVTVSLKKSIPMSAVCFFFSRPLFPSYSRPLLRLPT